MVAKAEADERIIRIDETQASDGRLSSYGDVDVFTRDVLDADIRRLDAAAAAAAIHP